MNNNTTWVCEFLGVFCGVTHFSHLLSCQKNIYLFYQSSSVECWWCFRLRDNIRPKYDWLQIKCIWLWKGCNLPCRYSFCVPPKLDLHVRPKLGEREVTFCHVTEWIEKKLQDEFQVKTCTYSASSLKTHESSQLCLLQKVFVLPNMDDIYLPLMHSGVDSPLASQSQQSQSSSTESIERIPPEISVAESD